MAPSPVRPGLSVTECHKSTKTHRGSLQRIVCECAHTDRVSAALAWPSHAAITAIGTPRRCINVAHECPRIVQPDPLDLEAVEHRSPATKAALFVMRTWPPGLSVAWIASWYRLALFVIHHQG
jgi:hypothetical protein